MTDIIIAQMIAERAHSGQFRRDQKTPYIEHVNSVVEKVTSDDEKIVAYLHDVVEDSEITVDDLADVGFSPNITEAVSLLTKTKTTDYDSYIQGIKSNPLARAVKIADMTSNLEDTPTPEQVEKYTKGLEVLS